MPSIYTGGAAEDVQFQTAVWWRSLALLLLLLVFLFVLFMQTLLILVHMALHFFLFFLSHLPGGREEEVNGRVVITTVLFGAQ